MTDDGSLVVRHYSDIGDLVPMLGCGSGAVDLQFRQVVDYPSRLALQRALANRPDLLEELDGRATDIEVRFPCHAGLKLAGYPHLIQGTAFLQTLEPDFQVQFDVCDAYAFADSGVGYVYSNLSAVIWESM